MFTTSEPIQICTNASVNKSASVDHHKKQYIINKETVNISSRSIQKYNIMVMHIIKLKTSNLNYTSTW